MDNYEISRDRAQAYFLGFDQDAIIRTWGLEYDEKNLYVSFFDRDYAVSRREGTVTRCWNGEAAGFGEVLSIFDLLCHEGTNKTVSGQFAPVNSLKGRPPVGVGTDFHTGIASRFDRDPEAFRRVCRELGGTPVNMGDLGFRFPVFGELAVILKFYRADEDFPAGLTLLWDENMLQFAFYETVFYMAGFLLETIGEKMGYAV